MVAWSAGQTAGCWACRWAATKVESKVGRMVAYLACQLVATMAVLWADSKAVKKDENWAEC